MLMDVVSLMVARFLVEAACFDMRLDWPIRLVVDVTVVVEF